MLNDKRTCQLPCSVPKITLQCSLSRFKTRLDVECSRPAFNKERTARMPEARGIGLPDFVSNLLLFSGILAGCMFVKCSTGALHVQIHCGNVIIYFWNANAGGDGPAGQGTIWPEFTTYGVINSKNHFLRLSNETSFKVFPLMLNALFDVIFRTCFAAFPGNASNSR